jgi:hypothetical protein
MNTEKHLENFDDKVDKEIRIEPKDWMPDDYRKRDLENFK